MPKSLINSVNSSQCSVYIVNTVHAGKPFCFSGLPRSGKPHRGQRHRLSISIFLSQNFFSKQSLAGVPGDWTVGEDQLLSSIISLFPGSRGSAILAALSWRAGSASRPQMESRSQWGVGHLEVGMCLRGCLQVYPVGLGTGQRSLLTTQQPVDSTMNDPKGSQGELHHPCLT